MSRDLEVNVHGVKQRRAASVLRVLVSQQQRSSLETHLVQRLLGPLGNVLGRVPLRVAGHQADESLLQQEGVRDTVGVDPKQTHAIV